MQSWRVRCWPQECPVLFQVLMVFFCTSFRVPLALLETFLFLIKGGTEVCTWRQAYGEATLMLGRGYLVLWMAFCEAGRIRGKPCAFHAPQILTLLLRLFIEIP